MKKQGLNEGYQNEVLEGGEHDPELAIADVEVCLDQSVQQYLRDIERYAFLSAEEEHLLVLQMLAGNKAARDRLIEAHLLLVVSMARKYIGLGLDFLDLIQEGNVGLIKATEKFDMTRGCRFGSYASWWIREGILHALSTHARAVRLPEYVINKMASITRVSQQLLQELGHEPTLAEVAERMGIEVEALTATIASADQGTVSLDLPLGEDEEMPLIESIQGETSADFDEALYLQGLSTHLHASFVGLTERERQALIWRYGLDGNGRGRTLVEVGEMLGVSSSAVRAHEMSALRKLRSTGCSIALKDFWVERSA
ncbi:MAG TPA: RNA polymerase sigma factor RpoD/SigA [Ktedonosporobacter sp.]|nr:RNA polymerase sigma factor RpoD/SigA [Ktedonosporobacter sp.]